MPGTVVFFGTYDERTHPRVQVLREGFEARGHHVTVLNVPLGLDTAARVELARRPWLAPLLVAHLLGAWARLVWRARKVPRPDAVIVGYLGQFDVHLARLLFDAPIVLDLMVALGDTLRDRRVGHPRVVAALDAVDRFAVAAADLVLVDTSEHLETLPARHRSKGMVVPVGAPAAWVREPEPRTGSAQTRVIFFGLYTPLQGAPVIGAAIDLLTDEESIRFTMVGSGQQLAEARAAARPNPRAEWLDWVDPEQLPALVADHDICLGIFDSGPKAARVVPNKVYQGMAAGCAVVTADTGPQRSALGECGVLVPPGDAGALATALRELSHDRGTIDELRSCSHGLALSRYTPAAVVEDLCTRLM